MWNQIDCLVEMLWVMFYDLGNPLERTPPEKKMDINNRNVFILKVGNKNKMIVTEWGKENTAGRCSWKLLISEMALEARDLIEWQAHFARRVPVTIGSISDLHLHRWNYQGTTIIEWPVQLLRSVMDEADRLAEISRIESVNCLIWKPFSSG